MPTSLNGQSRWPMARPHVARHRHLGRGPKPALGSGTNRVWSPLGYKDAATAALPGALWDDEPSATKTQKSSEIPVVAGGSGLLPRPGALWGILHGQGLWVKLQSRGRPRGCPILGNLAGSPSRWAVHRLAAPLCASLSSQLAPPASSHPPGAVPSQLPPLLPEELFQTRRPRGPLPAPQKPLLHFTGSLRLPAGLPVRAQLCGGRVQLALPVVLVFPALQGPGSWLEGGKEGGGATPFPGKREKHLRTGGSHRPQAAASANWLWKAHPALCAQKSFSPLRDLGNFQIGCPVVR